MTIQSFISTLRAPLIGKKWKDFTDSWCFDLGPYRYHPKIGLILGRPHLALIARQKFVALRYCDIDFNALEPLDNRKSINGWFLEDFCQHSGCELSHKIMNELVVKEETK